MWLDHSQIFWAAIAAIIHLIGVLTAINALLSRRSSRSAIAWMISCITFPYLAVPLYWLLGKGRFEGYISSRRSSNSRFRKLISSLSAFTPEHRGMPDDQRQACNLFERLASMPFTQGNSVRLLINGENAFESIFRHIEEAKEYVLVQFFIIRSDELGYRLLDLLSRKAGEGVRVYLMYDQVGSNKLSRQFIRQARDAGINVEAFGVGHRRPKRFQINFRNHRKIVVVDGKWASMGGANLGVEYCGYTKRFGHWRDTMISLRGPAVQEAQLSFAEDWFFLTQKAVKMNWQPEKAKKKGQCALVLPTGPADELHACSMMFSQAINTAEKRLWITSPYFVPDNEIERALQLAALRGVDVRILLPNKPDHHLVYWASFTFLEDLEKAGVKFFRYRRGLLHQKALLVDDWLSFIGSANTDNRSFYLNFEVTSIIADRSFASEVEAMLTEDFSHSRRAGTEEYKRRSSMFHLAARLARLLSPIL